MSVIYSQTEAYQVLDVLGKGTFGKVVKCWRHSDGELVAVKILSHEDVGSQLMRNELNLITRLQSTFKRSHIVHFFEGFCDPTQHYLVFEMLQKNLRELQRESSFRSLPVRHIRTITCQILKALAKLRELAIIHADLKPENIMIVNQQRFPFRVKLIDFGSSSVFSEVRFVREPYMQTRFYRAPEILLGLPFCEKIDMWSLGCVMAELYLGWPLYPGQSEFEQVRYICETQGLPHSYLLNTATKTNRFFQLTRNQHGAPVWKLRPSLRASNGDIIEHRKYVFSSLDQLYNLKIPKDNKTFRIENEAAEITDCHHMVELIKRMLAFTSRQRIHPNAALRHSFITLTHLDSPDTQDYYDLSFQELQKALI
ncbi:homeodomain-interacting protein kinase 4-like [Clarias gariepinus]|uniref:homeodomain-interacting protein kinase 4-like n=1 Tax=Clarias gariepinus TaxID=13013 RepID=UPI00234C5EE9|nr:homeodomain-interacting protein kinase 4-like [Clarias gariepinus]